MKSDQSGKLLTCMKVSNFFILIAALVLPSIGYAQDTLRVNLNYRVKDDVYEKTQAVVPVFKYTGDSIEEFTRFGVEQKKVPQKFRLTLPDMKGCMDTAYGYLYFSGTTRPVNQGYRLMVIGNYRRRQPPAIIYTDKNDNFDLSDDGPPDTLTHDMYYLDLVLRNSEVPEGKYIVRLSPSGYRDPSPASGEIAVVNLCSIACSSLRCPHVESLFGRIRVLARPPDLF